MYIYTSRYNFDNYDDPYIFKPILKSDARFKCLNVYYRYHLHNENLNTEQIFDIWYCSDSEDNDMVKKEIDLANNVIQFLFTIPITIEYMNKKEIPNKIEGVFRSISVKKIRTLTFISNKITRFNKEKPFFEEIMKLYDIAFKNQINDRYEDAILYYFKVIEKIAKRHYIKFHERNYTKQVKRRNKNDLNIFLKKFLKENLNVSMTSKMLNTVVDEVYLKIRNESYNSIFLKISFFCNCKKVKSDNELIHALVKTRNKLAHGDRVTDNYILASLGTAQHLANEFISLFFFNVKYSKIQIKTRVINEVE